MQKTASRGHSEWLMRKLNKAAGEFEKEFGKAERLLVVDWEKTGVQRGQDEDVVFYRARNAFYKLKGREFKPVPEFFMKRMETERVDDGWANACFKAERFWGKISLFKAPEERWNVYPDKFGETILHELVHTSKKFRKALEAVKKKLSEKEGKDGAACLMQAVKEGFCDFASVLMADPLDYRQRFKERELEAVVNIRGVKDRVERIGWSLILHVGAEAEAYDKVSYSIGLNFFAKAHEVLQAKLAEYTGFLQAVPPEAEEIMSKYGGEKWAERVKASLPG